MIVNRTPTAKPSMNRSDNVMGSVTGSTKNLSNRLEQGTTLITVLLTITLLAVISGSFFQNSFSNEASVRNQAYQKLALTEANAALRIGEGEIAKLEKRPDISRNPLSEKNNNDEDSGSNGGEDSDSNGGEDSDSNGGNGNGNGNGSNVGNGNGSNGGNGNGSNGGNGSQKNSDYGNAGNIDSGIWKQNLVNYEKAPASANLSWYKQVESWWQSYASDAKTMNDHVDSDSYYVVEELFDHDDSFTETPQYNSSSGEIVYYRVTSRGISGPASAANVTLQSTYSKGFN